MFDILPPVGERIVLQRARQNDEVMAQLFHPYFPSFFNSGTAALAAAIAATISRAGISCPEVILPAYACPHLVSAILYANARPVLVDLAPDRPWMDLNALEAATGPNTVAVIAVDLFGIPERYKEIRLRLTGTGVRLIQDGAQAFPKTREARWQGDYVVLSFGRGKPVSLMHGGVVLAQNAELMSALPTPAFRSTSRFSLTRFYLRSLLYNALLSRNVYWVPSSFPFLGLGETRFVPLDNLFGMDGELLAFLPKNIQAYRQRQTPAVRGIHSMLVRHANGDVVDLVSACKDNQTSDVLLRYPILVPDVARREQLFDCLQRSGLGVSKMYQKALPDIAGLESVFAKDAVPEARRFANRLLTLPVHSSVRARDIKRMEDCFSFS